MICAAAATALAGAPALGEANADEGAIIHAAICSESGRRSVEIDFGGGEREDGSGHGPCHGARLVDGTARKRRDARQPASVTW